MAAAKTLCVAFWILVVAVGVGTSHHEKTNCMSLLYIVDMRTYCTAQLNQHIFIYCNKSM